MNACFPEIAPGNKPFKKIYVAIMLFVVGRAIYIAAKIDEDIKKEFEALPNDFCVALGVMPNGPYMIIGKTKKGKVKYLGWKPAGKHITLRLKIKNIEAAMLLFTFRESTAQAFCNDRYIVDGNLSHGLAIIRALNIIEMYLLPKVIAKLAVKRYPNWSQVSPVRKYVGRVLIYLGL